jgi:NAD(P)-dependent dehydrogenase (short-subunit alcohol dehydrogenase family)
MRQFKDKMAFVTGGASGIGLALGRAFALAGIKVMLADIEPSALDSALRELHEFGPNAGGVVCDVADPACIDGFSRPENDARHAPPDGVRCGFRGGVGT